MPGSTIDTTCLRLPSPQTEIRIGGQVMPRARLDSLETTLGGAPRATVSIGLGCGIGDAQSLRLEDLLPQIQAGSDVSATWLGGGTLPGEDLPPVLFEGRIVRVEMHLDAEGETLRFEAEDSAADLLRRRVGGQRIMTAAGQAQRVDGLRLAFNPDGRPNASKDPYAPEGGVAYTIFAPAGEVEAEAWTLDKAVAYLLSEFAAGDAIRLPSPEEIADAVPATVLRHVSLEGQTLGQALEALLELANARPLITVEPGAMGVTRRLDLWRLDRAPAAWVKLQPVGSDFDAQATTFESLTATMHFDSSPRHYVARGDRKLYESTFNLVAGWDDYAATYDPDDFCPRTNPNFASVRDVFRKWVLNESGQYTENPFDRGPAADLSALFEGQPYVRRRRHFLPCLSRDAQGRSRGVYVELSLDGGATWEPMTLAARILKDECGLYLPEDLLPARYLEAAMRRQVRVRVTATIESDACLTSERAEDGTAGLPGRTRWLQVPAAYRYRRVASGSRFHGDSGADEADDTARLQALVDAAYEADRRSLVPARIAVPWLTLGHPVGSRMPGVLGRRLDLVRAQAGYATDPVVRRVCHTFAPVVQTELELE
jgi:hypothetical protein